MKPLAVFFCAALGRCRPWCGWRGPGIALLASGLAGAPLPLCAAEPLASGVSAGALVVTDDAGHALHLTAPARRIVSLAPHATELIYEVGAGGALAAVSDASDYPEGALTLPHIGGYAGLDLERIVALRPDLVVAWSSGNSQAQIEALRHAGLTVFESDPHNIEEIASSLERFGTLTGHQRLGVARARELRRAMAALAEKERGKPHVTVFYEVWDQPLYTLGAPHLVTQLMQVCGASNLFGDINALAPEVSPEAVVARKPDLIVTEPNQLEALRAAWRARGLADAATSHHVVAINPDWLIRATSRIVLGTSALCNAVDQRRAAN